MGTRKSIADRGSGASSGSSANREEISITVVAYAPCGAAEPHVHHRHWDAFYVLEGELTFALGPAGDRIRMAAGGFVAAPPNLVHSFGNEGSADARFVNLHAPDAGFTRSLRARRDGGDPSYDQHDPPRGRRPPPRAEAIASGPGEGERLVLGNRIAIVKGVLADMCVTEWTIEGPLAGPHVPQRPQGVDAFYVLEGELAMTVEGAVHTAGPNMIASVPRGVPHGFDHRTSGTTRFLDVHAPDAGFADSLREHPGSEGSHSRTAAATASRSFFRPWSLRHLHHRAALAGGRHAERVALALHHERRNRYGVQLGQAAVLRGGAARSVHGKRQAEHSHGAGGLHRAARDARAQRAAADHERQPAQLAAAELVDHGSPGGIELVRGRGSAAPGHAVRLFDEGDAEALGECDLGGHHQVASRHASARAVSEHERRRRIGSRMHVGSRRTVRCLDLDRGHVRDGAYEASASGELHDRRWAAHRAPPARAALQPPSPEGHRRRSGVRGRERAGPSGRRRASRRGAVRAARASAARCASATIASTASSVSLPSMSGTLADRRGGANGACPPIDGAVSRTVRRGHRCSRIF